MAIETIEPTVAVPTVSSTSVSGPKKRKPRESNAAQLPKKRSKASTVTKPAGFKRKQEETGSSSSIKRARATSKTSKSTNVVAEIIESEDLPTAEELSEPEPTEVTVTEEPVQETTVPLPPLPASIVTDDGDEHIFEATSTHTELIKKTFNVMKDFIVDINIHMNKSRMYIANLNKNVDLVHVNLNKFDRYYCEPDNLVVTVPALDIYRVIATFSSKSVFSMYIKKRHFNRGIVSYLCLLCVDGHNNKYKEVEIKVMDSDGEGFEMPNIDYPSIITIGSADFQETIRGLNSVKSTHVTITAIGTDLTFVGSGGKSNITIHQGESQKTLQFKKKTPPSYVTSGTFSMVAFNTIIRCTPLNTSLELYLDNNRSLIAKYCIGNMGAIQYVTKQIKCVE